MPKFIINDPASWDGKGLSEGLELTPASLNHLFMFDFQEFSPGLYVFSSRDCDHDLLCEIVLELRESLVCLDEDDDDEVYLAPVITCNFPSISVQKFNEKIGFDVYLQGIVMFQFQLKILQQLFLFCEEKGAVNLILMINDTDLVYLDIYSRFIVSDKKVTTAKGEQTEIVIPIDEDTHDEIADFMDDVEKEFRKTLWHEQTVNAAFREYLKGRSLAF
jgi:hypothetical protein